MKVENFKLFILLWWTGHVGVSAGYCARNFAEHNWFVGGFTGGLGVVGLFGLWAVLRT